MTPPGIEPGEVDLRNHKRDPTLTISPVESHELLLASWSVWFTISNPVYGKSRGTWVQPVAGEDSVSGSGSGSGVIVPSLRQVFQAFRIEKDHLRPIHAD